MQNLFNTYTGPKVGMSVDPGWSYIRSGMQRNISTVVSYYRNRNFTVKNNHILVRLLHSSAISVTGSIEDFYSHHQDVAVRLTTTFGITSSLSRGVIFDGVFLGKSSKEILVANDGYQNPNDLEANWEDIRAVQFLDHPKSDTSLLLANGKAYSDETGYSVISINVPALFVQYRCWLKQQMALLDIGETASPTSTFIHKYVLPNMLHSQLDIAIFNRLRCLSFGAPMGVPLYRHAFQLIDYNDKIDKSLKVVVRMLTKKDRDFYTMMREIPLITQKSLLEYSTLPENAPTRQVVWADIIARIKLISFLFEINPSNGRKLSMMQINYLKKIYDWFASSQSLEQVPNKELVGDIDAELIRIRLMCKM